jgi:hypothetical protein
VLYGEMGEISPIENSMQRLFWFKSVYGGKTGYCSNINRLFLDGSEFFESEGNNNEAATAPYILQTNH